MHPFLHHKLLYIIGSYGLGRKPISPLCTRPFRQVTTACTHPSCPLHPLSMQLQAAHYSFLVISLLSLHPQQQILFITSFPVCFASVSTPPTPYFIAEPPGVPLLQKTGYDKQ
jgi:hypothetical protein